MKYRIKTKISSQYNYVDKEYTPQVKLKWYHINWSNLYCDNYKLDYGRIQPQEIIISNTQWLSFREKNYAIELIEAHKSMQPKKITYKYENI